MSSVNKVILIGNVGKDPDIREMGNGRVANLSVATSDSWKDKTTGEKKEKTEWHRVVVFNPHLVDLIANYVRKGTKLYVEGALQTKKWQDEAGSDKYATEVVLSQYKGEIRLLGGPNTQDEYQNAVPVAAIPPAATARAPQQPRQETVPPPIKRDYSPRSPQRAAKIDDFDDDIPF